MKRKISYSEAELEVILFDNLGKMMDIITASGDPVDTPSDTDAPDPGDVNWDGWI